MLKKLALISIVIMLVSSCQTTGEADTLAFNLKYPKKPSDEFMTQSAEPIIRSNLKDPDSLKNLEMIESFKCYISKIEFTDNVSPKYDDGHWCAMFKYYGTNSYGAYVMGTQPFIYMDNVAIQLPISETVRKTGDVWQYYTSYNGK